MGCVFKYAIAVICAIIASYGVKFYAEKNPNTVEFLGRVTTSDSLYVRLFQSAQGLLLQTVHSNPVATFKEGSLRGQLIVLSGGNGGIGFETAKGLVKRGGDVIIVGRNERKIEEAVQRIKNELLVEGIHSVSLQYIVADTSDLDSVVKLVQVLQHHFSARKIDQLILNAAVWPNEYSVSAQGHEIAFATNTLGPHLFLRALIQQDVLKPNARVISVTGDIYVSVFGSDDETATPDFKYGTPSKFETAGQVAYCRSKLGMMWLFDEIHALVPSLQMFLVHPGVIGSNLVQGNPMPAFLMLNNEQGAQTTLVVATAGTDLLESGAYYHNTLGKLVLPASDPAKNATKRKEFFAVAEGLIAPYLAALRPQQQQAQEQHQEPPHQE